MKTAGCALGCLGAVAAGISVIVALAALGAWLEPDGGGAPPAPARVARGFASAEDADGWALSFGFADHHRGGHRVTCRVERADLEGELAWFGFQEDALWSELNRRLEDLLRTEIRRHGVQDYYGYTVEGRGSYRWKWRVEGETPEPEYSRAIAASRDVARWIEQVFPTLRRELEQTLVAPHGFRVDADGDLVIDYERLIQSGGQTLESCRRALVEAGAGAAWRRNLSLFLAFFQDLVYEVPPVREQGRYTLGLWVPTEVLVRGRGDCDSKSVALSSMLRRLGRRLLFILLPRHALIGVEMKPGPGENFVRIGNRYFVLCDPAGPARIPPGGRSISGNYEYILIEPEARRAANALDAPT